MGSSRGTGLSGAVKQSVSNVSQQTGGATPLMSGSSFVPGVSTASPKTPLEAQEVSGINAIEEPFGGLGGVRGATLSGRSSDGVFELGSSQPSVQVALSGNETSKEKDEREKREAAVAPPILNEEKAQEAKEKSKDWLTRVSTP
jgi:hypothetical protein